jgi:hypothetical protein
MKQFGEIKQNLKLNFFLFLSKRTMTSFWRGINVNDRRMMERMTNRCEELSTKIIKKRWHQ